MRELYPPIEPFDDAFLKVTDLHTVHYEQVGNPKGKKVLFLHDFVHGGFLASDTQLLDDVSKIAHLPAVIVQGRYDMVCPAASAWALHQRWPKSKLVIVPDAGHSIKEPGILSALVQATDDFAL